MEFRLIFQGTLPAASQKNTRTEDKHRIRKALHPQLRELWKADYYLRTRYMEMRIPPVDAGRFAVDDLADDYQMSDYRFAPLVGSRAGDAACALDILFLRRDQPGDLVKHGGDIDNRMKVLLDALRMPDNLGEVAAQKPTQDEDPFFCLLRDDKLITKLRIVTDRLLTPVGVSEHVNDVHLVIRVKTIPDPLHWTLRGS